jgi:hypothetical protein
LKLGPFKNKLGAHSGNPSYANYRQNCSFANIFPPITQFTISETS